jgi:adenylate kinase
VVLGPSIAALADRSRSLNIEHVSSVEMIRQEISRRTPAGLQASRALGREQLVPDETTLGVLRRWFWTRKPDAGFVLTDFPATLLQAKVFDEWLEARGMFLTACVVTDPVNSSPAIIDYYRTQGLDIIEPEQLLSN